MLPSVELRSLFNGPPEQPAMWHAKLRTAAAFSLTLQPAAGCRTVGLSDLPRVFTARTAPFDVRTELPKV